MGRAAISLPDEKMPIDVENEKLLDVEDDSALLECEEDGKRHRSHSWSEYVPSIREVVRLVLFCAVTVVGMTFISEFVPTPQWSTSTVTSQSAHDIQSEDMNVCSSTVHGTKLSLDYDLSTQFSFTQLSQDHLHLEDSSLAFVRTVGTIEARIAEEGEGSHIRVDLDIRGSDSRLTSSEALGIEKTDSSLVVRTPRRIPVDMISDISKIPCLHVSAILWISPGTDLKNLGIDSETLSVVFHPGLDYARSKDTQSRTYSGSLSTYSRETTIDVTSGSVTGVYPLYDLLSIHTDSGSINVNIDPKNASADNVKPAFLRVSSTSGSIRTMASTVSVPDRDYQTTISTSSGSIDAGILHGLRTALRTINGRINADLYPYGHNDSKTDIEAHCTSGSMDITLHSSLSHPTAPLKKLYGNYHGVSGGMSLYYPAQWQGGVEGTTLSGSIHFDWQGLKIIKDGKDGWVKRTIEAVRGDGEGTLFFYETSGSVTLVGESGGL